MRVEQIYLGSREEITELVTKNHTAVLGEGHSVEAQLDRIEGNQFKFGCIFMMSKKDSNNYSIDKWFVQLRDYEKEGITRTKYVEELK